VRAADTAADADADAEAAAGRAPPITFDSLGQPTLGAQLAIYNCSGVPARNHFLDLMLEGQSEIKACCLSSNPNLNPYPKPNPNLNPNPI
tara:strand:+ start:160 stop:429 length:270 start_codon:yes stop_codon:yes gene_type:complete